MRTKYRAYDKIHGFEYTPYIELEFDENGFLLNDENHQYSQFTGLHDSKGKEIYCGDIVSDHLGIGSVEYSDKYAGFRVNYHNGRAKWFYDYSLKGERESIEVIGNIYENSELLND